MELRSDVVVLGAGAAGLAAARTLGEARCETILLEARSRIGGRIFTRDEPDVPLPIELGAEFVHGTPAVSLALARAARVPLLDTADMSFAYEDGALSEREDPFAIVSRVMRGAQSLREDVSVEEFTRACDERDRRFTRAMVAGFDAADPARASTRAIAEEWSDGENGQTSREFRPAGGYAPLLRTLRGAIDDAHVRVMLDTAVGAVRRDANGVTIEARSAFGKPLTIRARAAVVTFSVGVLQSGAVAFDPPLPASTRAALDGLVMGPVIKLALRFRSAWWERVADGRYRDGAFFHRAEGAFPTYWTLLPQRAPVLIAWAGGPNADALADVEEAQRVARALDGLRTLFGDEIDPADELEAAFAHDWQRDPYARGAYSYVAVGGTEARAALAAPVDGRLFFAGEAVSTDGEAGTVAGALETGERAARAALAALSA